MALSLLLQEIVSLWLNLPGYFLSLTIQWTPEDYCSVLPSFLKRLSFHNSVSVALFSKPLAHAVTMNQFIITATSPPGLLNAVYDQHSNIVVLFLLILSSSLSVFRSPHIPCLSYIQRETHRPAV